MKVGRKDFLLGLGGAVVGVPLGALGQRRFARYPDLAAGLKTPEAGKALVSYSQSGEDIVVDFIFSYLHVKEVTYLDIGAYDPVLLNNTYYFYLKGHRGVLVEPNPAICEKLREVRPADTTLVAGIGVTSADEAEYYMMTEPSWNTFSKEEAEHQARITDGRVTIKEIRKVPLLNVNDVIRDHFDGPPTFVSIDAEGWHLAILKSIDYQRFRPKVICVETLVSGSNGTIPEIGAFMESQGYADRGGSFVNTIFVDREVL